MNTTDILPLLRGVKRRGRQWMALCPSHDDTNPSLSIRDNDGLGLIFCHAGCSYQDIAHSLGLSSPSFKRRDSHELNAGTPRRDFGSLPEKRIHQKELSAEYNYRDGAGRFLYQIVRYRLTYDDGSTGKKFSVRRRPLGAEKPSNDGWVYNTAGIPLVLYNLDAVRGASLVYVVEGEKDVETLRKLGVVATCNPFGAGKWKEEYAESLRGKTAAVLPDNDESGRLHADKVARSLHGVAEEVLMIDLPGLPEKGDVTDFVEAGGTEDELMDLVSRAETWSPSSGSPAAETASKFVFTTLGRLLDEEPEEVSFVWENTLPTGGFSICSAKPKIGKSTFARNLAVAVATGTPFLGRETRQGKVLYLCLEEKRSEVRNHFEKMGVSSEDILIYTGPTPKEAILELAAAIAEAEPLLVIIDPLSRVIRVPDFNDYGSMARGLEPVIDLARRSGCHILALHHDSKIERNGGDALLGSTALFGAVDCHIQLKKRDSGRTILTTQRYGEDMPETVIELNKLTGVVSDVGELQSFNLEKAKTLILDSFADSEALNESEIKSRVEGYSKGVVSKAIRALVDEDKLGRTGEGKRGNPYIYSKPSSWVN